MATAAVCAGGGSFVVADRESRSPLPHAVVINAKGSVVAVSGEDGSVDCDESVSLPLTVKLLGFKEVTVDALPADTLFLDDAPMRLPEVSITPSKRNMLHIMAYVREYSTLASYSDTITMFREKMVDFMVPCGSRPKFKGWLKPRILNSKSYYRFSDYMGLDSVSDRCDHYFSWSDHIGVVAQATLPKRFRQPSVMADTLKGKYVDAEIWSRGNDRISVQIDGLASEDSRKWYPGLDAYFSDRVIDFEKFNLNYIFVDNQSNHLTPADIIGYSYNINSRYRGRNMFMFGRHDEPFFVTTYTEVYLVDRGYLSEREARQWLGRRFYEGDFEIVRPATAPALGSATLSLIERVEAIDHTAARLSIVPDRRLVNEKLYHGRKKSSWLKGLFRRGK